MTLSDLVEKTKCNGWELVVDDGVWALHPIPSVSDMPWQVRFRRRVTNSPYTDYEIIKGFGITKLEAFKAAFNTVLRHK